MRTQKDQTGEVAADPPSPPSLMSLLGGWRASVDATLPPVAFVVTWSLAGRSIPWGAAAAVVVSALIAGYRLWRGTRPRAVIIGLLGVCAAALIALYTGRAVDFFLPQLFTNAASALVWIGSILVRWPLLGVVVGTLLGQKGRWRRDPDLLRAYRIASWVWVMQYVIRTSVLGTFYYLGWTEALGFARVAMTWPLIAACVAVSGLVLKLSLPSAHPGITHPRTPDERIEP